MQGSTRGRHTLIKLKDKVKTNGKGMQAGMVGRMSLISATTIDKLGTPV